MLLEACLDFLQPRPGAVFLDATIGGGGHSKEILERVRPGGLLIGLDRDPLALARARENLAPYKENLVLVHANFAGLREVLAELKIEGIDGCLFDLGLSSLQLANPARGFSYQKEGPLDMRYNPQEGLRAWDLVNHLPEAELTRILKTYGEEKWAARIAAFICMARARKPLETTTELVAVVKAAIPARARRSGPHPAKRTFQALRIAVNQELDALKKGLAAAGEVLSPGGRLVVISFHSLEDQSVKHYFQTSGLKVLTRKPLYPSALEKKENPRARSAKLRAAEKF